MRTRLDQRRRLWGIPEKGRAWSEPSFSLVAPLLRRRGRPSWGAYLASWITAVAVGFTRGIVDVPLVLGLRDGSWAATAIRITNLGGDSPHSSLAPIRSEA